MLPLLIISLLTSQKVYPSPQSRSPAGRREGAESMILPTACLALILAALYQLLMKRR